MTGGNLRPTLKHLWMTTKHKAFVFRAGLWTGAPLWRLIIHDWTKYTPSEAPHYGRQFFGDKSDPAGFAAAWLHHQNSNNHHWEFYISRTAHTNGHSNAELILPMPMSAVREMVADWFGASRAYDGQWPETIMGWKWFTTNWYRISSRMHPQTIKRVERVMREMFAGCEWVCLACQDDDCARYGDNIGGSVCYEIKCPVCERLHRTVRKKPATAAAPIMPMKPRIYDDSRRPSP